jgi:hypothetical protein
MGRRHGANKYMDCTVLDSQVSNFLVVCSAPPQNRRPLYFDPYCSKRFLEFKEPGPFKLT